MNKMTVYDRKYSLAGETSSKTDIMKNLVICLFKRKNASNTVQFPQCKHLGTYSTHKQGFFWRNKTKQVKKAKLLLKPNVAMQFPFLLSAAFN